MIIAAYEIKASEADYVLRCGIHSADPWVVDLI